MSENYTQMSCWRTRDTAPLRALRRPADGAKKACRTARFPRTCVNGGELCLNSNAKSSAVTQFLLLAAHSASFVRLRFAGAARLFRLFTGATLHAVVAQIGPVGVLTRISAGL